MDPRDDPGAPPTRTAGPEGAGATPGPEGAGTPDPPPTTPPASPDDPRAPAWPDAPDLPPPAEVPDPPVALASPEVPDPPDPPPFAEAPDPSASNPALAPDPPQTPPLSAPSDSTAPGDVPRPPVAARAGAAAFGARRVAPARAARGRRIALAGLLVMTVGAAVAGSAYGVVALVRARQVADANAATGRALAALTADTHRLAVYSRFNGLTAQLEQDVGIAEGDYVQEVRDAEMGCKRAAQIEADAARVVADMAAVHTDDADFASQQRALSDATARVQGDQDRLSAAWDHLQRVVAADPGAKAGYTLQQVNAALYAGSQQLTLSRMLLVHGRNAVGAGDLQVVGLDTAARVLAGSLSC